MNSNDYTNDGNGSMPVVSASGMGEEISAFQGNRFNNANAGNNTMGGNLNIGDRNTPENTGAGTTATNSPEDMAGAVPTAESRAIGSIPMIPLPTPDQTSTGYPGNSLLGTLGTIITVLPRPVTPCFYCNSSSYGTIRFLNAAVGYNPFMVAVNNRTVVDTLEYAEISEYGRISSGYQTITISGRNGYIYISKQIRVTVGATMTIAIVNTAGGLDLVEVNDTQCYTPLGGACLRVGNLSYNAGPLTLSSYSGNIVFNNVSFREVTSYMRIIPARYEIYVSNANEALLSTEITARSGSQYTVYLFNWNESPTAIRTLIIEDRK